MFAKDNWRKLPIIVKYLCVCFMAQQDYFTHFELSQLQGGAKTRDLQEKTPDHP